MMSKLKSKFTIKQDYKIVYLGETGAGKSTLINMTMCLLHGLEYIDPRKIAIPQNSKIEFEKGQLHKFKMDCNIDEFKGNHSEQHGEESQSQTNITSIYKIKDDETGHTLTIVDTPGLGDTRGEMQDQENIKQIVHAIVCLGGVNAICLVHNATKSRLQASTEISLIRLKEMFPKECLPNMIICLTNSPKTTPSNCIDSLVKLGFSPEKIIKFENSCLVPHSEVMIGCKKYIKDDDDADEYAEESRVVKRQYWKNNLKSLESLLEMVRTSKPLGPEAVKKIFITKEAVKKSIEYHTSSLSILKDNQRAVEQKKREIVKIQNEIEANTDTTKTVTVIEKVTEKVKRRRLVTKWIAPKKVYGALSTAFWFVAGIVTFSISWWLSNPEDFDVYFEDPGNAYRIEEEEEYWDVEEKFVPKIVTVTDAVKVSLLEQKKKCLDVVKRSKEATERELIETTGLVSRAFIIIRILIKQMEEEIQQDPIREFERSIGQLKKEIVLMNMKIHAEKGHGWRLLDELSNMRINVLKGSVERLENEIKVYERRIELVKLAKQDVSKITNSDLQEFAKTQIDATESNEKNEFILLEMQRMRMAEVKPCIINKLGVMQKMANLGNAALESLRPKESPS